MNRWLKLLCAASVVAGASAACAAPDDAKSASTALRTTMAPPPHPPPSPADQEYLPVVDFPALAPAPGTTASDLAEWTALVRNAFFDPYVAPKPRLSEEGRRSPFLQERNELMTIDILDSTPAYINALIGKDMSDAKTIVATSKLIEYWQFRERYKMHFFFDGNAQAVSEVVIANRVKVIKNWAAAWRMKVGSPGSPEKFRESIAVRRDEYAEVFRD